MLRGEFFISILAGDVETGNILSVVTHRYRQPWSGRRAVFFGVLGLRSPVAPALELQRGLRTDWILCCSSLLQGESGGDYLNWIVLTGGFKDLDRVLDRDRAI